jgi:hypothetical protein
LQKFNLKINQLCFYSKWNIPVEEVADGIFIYFICTFPSGCLFQCDCRWNTASTIYILIYVCRITKIKWVRRSVVLIWRSAVSLGVRSRSKFQACWLLCQLNTCKLETGYCFGYIKKKNSMVWVRERTIPIERPPLVGEVIANFCG